MNAATGSPSSPVDEENPTIQEQQPEIRIQMPQLNPQARPPPNLPAGNLLGSKVDYNRTCVPLYHALIKGDWEAAKDILGRNSELVRSSITGNCETALHIAASVKSTKSREMFVQYLVTVLMSPADLALQNLNYNTALCLAAAAGNVEIARIMVGKNNDLLTIPGSNGMMPLYMAALYERRDMVNYLYESEKMSSPHWTDQTRTWVLLRCAEAGFFDIALNIVRAWPELAPNTDLLGILAGKTDAFTGTKPRFFRIRKIFAFIRGEDGPDEKESQALQLLRTIWTEIVKLDKQIIDDIIRGPADTIREPANQSRGPATYSSRVLFVAAEMGNTKFVVELIRQCPDLIWKKNGDNLSIFHVAVSNRQEGIYNLLYEIGSMKDMITPLKDKKNNNMLHLVGKIAKKKQLEKVSGVALQMQRELLWFKEVEAMIPPSYRERKNNDGLTPYELFTEEHKDLMSQGEKWMKETASHCMVVATLIATMVFTAAFTIPGGYNTGSGIPELRKKRAFIAFVISDAVSLFSSSTSIVIFLSILTSHYAEHDFMESLPKKLITGLATLFLSMISMMVAFSVSFFALYYHHLLWVPVTISIFPVIPTFLYLRYQYPLLADVYHWTYGSRNLFKPKKVYALLRSKFNYLSF